MNVLIARQSNHMPIQLEMKKNNQPKRNKKRVFRFKDKWLLDEESKVVIEEAWDGGVPKPIGVKATQ